MSIRRTVTLDDDVLDRVRRKSRSRGASFRDTLNDLLRMTLRGIWKFSNGWSPHTV